MSAYYTRGAHRVIPATVASVLLGDRSHGLRAHSTLPAANVCSSSGFSFPKSLPLPLHCPFFTARFKSAAAAALVPVPASTAYLASLSATWHPSRFSCCHGDFTQSCLAACKLPRADFILSLPRPLAPADWAEEGPRTCRRHCLFPHLRLSGSVSSTRARMGSS